MTIHGTGRRIWKAVEALGLLFLVAGSIFEGLQWNIDTFEKDSVLSLTYSVSALWMASLILEWLAILVLFVFLCFDRDLFEQAGMVLFTIGAILELIAAGLDGGTPGITGLTPWVISSLMELVVGLGLLLLSCFENKWTCTVPYGEEFWGFVFITVGSFWELKISPSASEGWDVSGWMDGVGDIVLALAGLLCFLDDGHSCTDALREVFCGHCKATENSKLITQAEVAVTDAQRSTSAI
jgi:hypothetical protein